MASSSNGNNIELVPGQSINHRRRRRNKKPNNTAQAEQSEAVPSNDETKPRAVPSKDNKNNVKDSSNINNNNNVKGNKNNVKKNGKNVKDNVNIPKDDKNGNANGKDSTTVSSNKQDQKKKRRRRKKPAAQWKRLVANDAVDPITLESLTSLSYPPFALAAAAPFTVLKEWPPNEDNGDNNIKNKEVIDKERQERILQEQWGNKLVKSNKDNEPDEPTSTKPAHFHLFDGQALAYWMVGSNQFMDPLNRRDVTRDELLNLDVYLQRHGFDNINVTDAYDAKGITISSAGAMANTPEGRAAVRRQIANNLLNSLFGGSSRQQPQNNNNNNRRQANTHQDALAAQYQAFEQQNRPHNVSRRDYNNDAGIYGDTGGIMIIDDDMHPELRGTALEFVPDQYYNSNNNNAIANNAARLDGSSAFWSASQIASRNGHLDPERDFPSLDQVMPATSRDSNTNNATTAPDTSQKSKSLSKIFKTVKKTSPEELQRQARAREAARRKAQLSHMTFGSNPAAWIGGVAASTTALATANNTLEPSTAKLQRNKNLADALGVTPVTLRGWARPCDSQAQLDEFGRELGYTVYPASLVTSARNNMALLNKIERRWKTFLADDKEASLSLGRMDKASRKLIHEYGVYWKLQTESFDPEPKRYVHCVKTLDTAAPYPFLSKIAQSSWRANSVSVHDKYVSMTASVPRNSEVVKDFTNNTRFDSLAPERPILQLLERTLPVEHTPQRQDQFIVAAELERQRQRAAEERRRKAEQKMKKQELLALAFASDDDEDESVVAAVSDDESDWEEQQAVYSGSDDEE